MGHIRMLSESNRIGASLVICLGLGALFCLATGCESIEYATGRDLGSPDSSELKTVQFDDIPVPYGFSVQDRLNQSLTYEHGVMRVGQLEYRGQGMRPKAAAEFYRNQMPLTPNGWTLTNDFEQAGQSILHFDKNPYRCVVTIKREKNDTYIKVEVDTLHES
jgi:hypothetical protein